MIDPTKGKGKYMKRILAGILCLAVLASASYAAAVKKAEVKPVIKVEPTVTAPAAKEEAAPAFVKKLTSSGYLRVRYSAWDSAAINDAFAISRARIKVTGELAPDLMFLIQPDFAGLSTGATVTLADVYAEAKMPFGAARFGQFLVPFGYDSAKYKAIYSTGFVPTHYGTIVSSRDYGIRVMGRIPVLAGFNYDAALINGTGTADNNKSKDLVGRINYKNDSLDIGVSGYYGHAGAGNIEKKDGGVDVEYKIDSATVVAEYMVGPNLAATSRVSEASLQLSKLINNYEPLIRYEIYDPNTATAGNMVNTLTLGGAYLFDKTTKLLLNYNLVGEETTQINNNNLQIELQAQI